MKLGKSVQEKRTSQQENSRISKEALEHAWDWFSLHAEQRMKSFNFFLIAMPFLAAAYGTLLEKRPVAAFVVGLFGAWVAFGFNRMERRTKQLVKAGEEVLRPLQKQLADRTGNSAIMMLEAVEPKAPGCWSYSATIDRIQLGSVVVFLLGAAYAIAPVFLAWARSHRLSL